MANVNSFSETAAQLTKSVNDAISLIQGYGTSAISPDASVDVNLSNGETITLPSLLTLSKRMDRAEKTVSAFVSGKGVVETDDGTFRQIKAEAVPQAPDSITSQLSVDGFKIDRNWFFEDLMFPKCTIELDLKGEIDDNSDRIYVNRVILDYSNPDIQQYYTDNIAGNDLSYASLIEMLERDQIAYSEDTETIELPLSYEKYYGEFNIEKIYLEAATNDTQRLWYYLDTLNYKQVDENGLTVSSAYQLSIGDYIRYNDSLYKISKIDQAAKKIAMDYYVGYDTPSVGTKLNVYNSPFSSKKAKIGIGYNEIDIIYIKGINEAFNILSKDWSLPIMFITNNLKLNGSGMTLAEYYGKYIVDFGADMIAKAKQGTIYAYDGEIPNTPSINVNNLKVVQINTQLEATLESETYNNLVSNIYAERSRLSDLRRTIANNKEKLNASTSEDERQKIMTKINDDTNSFNSSTAQYNSLVEELNTLLNNNGAIGYAPKYHVRGFFPIPAPKYTDASNNIGKQEIIGFDIMYRYIHTDNTGVELNTFNYESEGNKTVNAVFSDWNITQSKIKEQIYDEVEGVYVWQDESVTDGEIININQIDIPIRSGEKVQIKVRSISEAGYPSNPLKSAWSEIVTVSFPENLMANDSVTKVIEDTKNDVTSIVLQETMSSAGVYTHISDTTDIYKHSGDNISVRVYDASTANGGSANTYKMISIQEAINQIITKLNSLNSDSSTNS